MNPGLNNRKFSVSGFCLAIIFLVVSSIFFAQILLSQRTILEIYRDGAAEDGKIFYQRLVKQISFKDYNTRVNLIVDHYSRGGFPSPEKFPLHTIQWRALLNVPVSGEYWFDIQADGPVVLKVGDSLILDKAGKYPAFLSRGSHNFNLRYVNKGQSHRGLQLGNLKIIWKCAGAQEWSIMPSGVFSRSEAKSWFNDRWILSFLSIVCFLMFFSLMLQERKFLKLHRAGLIITLIVLLGGTLRFYQYNIIPLYNETMDEFNLGWMGWSLLKLGVPVGWDWLSGYGDWSSACKFWFGNIFQILSPAFSYPPLFYTLIGGVAILSGAEELLQVTVSSMRILPVIFSTTTIFLIYFFLKDKFGRFAALLSSLLFAVIPTIVVSGRLAKGENMFSFLLLLSLILYNRSLHSTTCRKAFWIGVIMGLACLAKFTALSCLLGICFLYLSQKKWKQAITVFCVGAFFASLYFVYGAIIDWGMFVRVFSSQRARLPFLDVPVKMILHPKITDTVFFDGGILFLWVSIICISFLRDKGIARDIGIIFAVYFLAISVYVSSRHVFGWYTIPLYPLLCAGGGIVLHELFRRKSVLLMTMFIGLGVMMNLQYCLPDHLVRNLLFPKFLVAALIFPILPWQIWKTKFCSCLAVSGIALVVLVYVMTSIIMVLKFSGIYY